VVILEIFSAHQRKTIKLSERSESLRNLGDDRAAALIFRTDPVERVERANLIASCSGYFDRISLASKKAALGASIAGRIFRTSWVGATFV